MSKIGRKSINIGDVSIELKGSSISYKGKLNSGTYEIPKELEARLDGAELKLVVSPTASKRDRSINRIWGMHRALLSNIIIGSSKGFTRQLKINGLGYKAVASGDKIVLSLGFSHKIDFKLPQGVKLDIDRSGQLLTFSSHDKALVGHVCSKIRALRPPEPYKGTGIKFVEEVITRKAGKTKAS